MTVSLLRSGHTAYPSLTDIQSSPALVAKSTAAPRLSSSSSSSAEPLLSILNPGDPGYLEPEWEWARETSIVYTWVNGSEAGYRAVRQRWGGPNAVGGGRDRDNDDLKFSLRTLTKFMPWHNGTIYLVSPSPPSWADLSNPRFRWVNQDELIPKEDQPTFNSNAVEQYLHLLPGLTDRFIQMNDDYMLYNPVHPSDFFTAQGGIRLFLETSVIQPHKFDTKTPPIWLGSTFHSVDILREAYGPINTNQPRYLQHAPFVYYKQAFQNMHQRFYRSFRVASAHKFRHYEDVLTPLMHHGYVVQEGSHCCGMKYEIVPLNEVQKMMKFMRWGTDTAENARRLEGIKALSPKFFNVNDEMGNDVAKATLAQTQLKDAFVSLFGNDPSPFEIL